MRILFDQGTPAPLRHVLKSHTVMLVFEMGWAELENGRLLTAAEDAFDALITADQSLRYQQNLVGRRLAILVLPTTNWIVLKEQVSAIADAVDRLRVGDVVEFQLAGD